MIEGLLRLELRLRGHHWVPGRGLGVGDRSVAFHSPDSARHGGMMPLWPPACPLVYVRATNIPMTQVPPEKDKRELTYPVPVRNRLGQEIAISEIGTALRFL